MGNRISAHANDSELSATTSPHTTRPQINTEQLEPVKLACVFPPDETFIHNENVLNNLYSITTHINHFDNESSFKKWLASKSADEKIYLILSSKLARQITSHVHDVASIKRIYIYSSASIDDSSWILNYSKICSIAYNPDGLTYRLLNDHLDLHLNSISEMFHIFRNHSRTTSDVTNDSCLCFLPFLKVLIESPDLSPSPTSNLFLDFFRRFYSRNPKSLKLIKQIENDYTDDGSIKTLLNNGPLARFINKALCEQDVSLLFYFRFYFLDIYKYLLDHRLESADAYAMQTMSLDDIKHLQENPNLYMMSKNFLLTSTNILKFPHMDARGTQNQNVLIQIHAENQDNTWPFAGIETVSILGQKTKAISKIVFMPGSIFKIKSLVQMTDSIWKLELILVGYDQIKFLSISTDNNLLHISDLFDKYDQINKMTDYYLHLLHELPPNHYLIPLIKEKLNINTERSSNQNNLVVIKSSLIFTPMETEMLNVLHSISNESIKIYENISEINFDHIFNGKFSIIFARYDIVSAIRNRHPSQLTVQYFAFDDRPNVNRQIGTVSHLTDFIFQLADDLGRLLLNESVEDLRMNKNSLSKQKQQLAGQIDNEMKKIYQKYSENDQPSICTEVYIIHLTNTRNTDNVAIEIERHFKNLFPNYLTFYDAHEFQMHILMNNSDAPIFTIVESDDQNQYTTLCDQLKNIKYIYRIQQSSSTNEIFQDLTLKLIDHYNNLANAFEDRNDSIKQREMLITARKLTELLNNNLNN